LLPERFDVELGVFGRNLVFQRTKAGVVDTPWFQYESVRSLDDFDMITGFYAHGIHNLDRQGNLPL